VRTTIIGKRAGNSLVLNHGTVFRCAPMGSKNSEQDCIRSFDLTCSLHGYFSQGDAAAMEGWRSDSSGIEQPANLKRHFLLNMRTFFLVSLRN
jgi:hypothetical protein